MIPLLQTYKEFVTLRVSQLSDEQLQASKTVLAVINQLDSVKQLSDAAFEQFTVDYMLKTDELLFDYETYLHCQLGKWQFKDLCDAKQACDDGSMHDANIIAPIVDYHLKKAQRKAHKNLEAIHQRLDRTSRQK